jgi:hypothetical protein
VSELVGIEGGSLGTEGGEVVVAVETRTGKGPWTYEELSRRTPEDHVRREIIDGWLYIDGQPVDDPMAVVVSDSATTTHQYVVLELAAGLRDYRADHPGHVGLSPLDVASVGTVIVSTALEGFEVAVDDLLPYRSAGRASSMALTKPSSSGVTMVRKRVTWSPPGAMRNFSKFQ